ncbi:MAG: right-handed parallel beta-helix repeat-containing protein [Acidobacteriia bacterium]|nr:right-handed parallel beta-helix repeat-containing protein [Terriglobia bacterium]
MEHIGFLSYASEDNAGEDHSLTALRKALEHEVGLQLGRRAPIFQASVDIPAGDQWHARIKEAATAAQVFIAILTPNYYGSAYCAEELRIFLEEEERRGRSDLILPLSYIPRDAARLEDAPVNHDLAEAIVRHQIVSAQALYEATPTRLLFDERSRPLLQQLAFQIALRVKEQRGSPRVPVLTVGPGEMYDSIVQAIRDAPPGAQTRVRPRIYLESIIIDRPVEIIGESAGTAEIPGGRIRARTPGAVGHKVEVHGIGPALTFNAPYARIANLVLRPSPDSRFPAHCVVVSDGHLDMSSCDVTGSGFACVVVRGRSEVQLSLCRIHHSGQGGVLFEGESTGTVMNCLVYRNRDSGIHVQGRSTPVIRDNVVCRNSKFGVFVYEQSRPMVSHNLISSNELGGILVWDPADPLVARNRVERNGLGVVVNGRDAVAKGRFIANAIRNNRGVGVIVEAHAAPDFCRNTITGNQDSGVVLQAHGVAGRFIRNEITGNAGVGVHVKDGDPEIRRNRFRGNARAPVEGRGAEAILRMNEVEQGP